MITSICAEKLQHAKGHNYVYIFAKSTEIFVGKDGSTEDMQKMPLSSFVLFALSSVYCHKTHFILLISNLLTH